MQQVRIGVVGKPAGIPGAVDSQPQADRIDFLTHYAVSSRSRTTTVRRLHGFTILPARPRARARRSEEHTSELQSLMRISYAVFRLKKTNYTTLLYTTIRLLNSST